MTKHRGTSWLLSVVIILLLLAGCTANETAHDHNAYTCPMHPSVVSDGPGTCPVCGMDLVRREWTGEEIEVTESLSKLLRSPNEAVLASVKTVKGEYKSVPVSVQAQGVVTYDTRNIYTIASRVGGRLERVYLTYAFQPVTKGQKIAEIYSPELITAQKELLFLLENDPENSLMIDHAKKKLELSGLSNRQINDLGKLNAPANTFSIYSPYSGYLITDTQPVTPTTGAISSGPRQADGEMPDGMAAAASKGSGPSQPVNTGVPIMREGDYVAAGQTLFTVVNPRAFRIELNLSGAYVGSVSLGTRVQLNFGDEKSVAASVDFVQPFFTGGQDFLKVRIYTNDSEGLRIGQLVNATIDLDSIEALWVPEEAVVDLGIKKVVFVKERDVLKPKIVTTGAAADGLLEITSGLASSDEIAAKAQYLVDSENFIRTEQ